MSVKKSIVKVRVAAGKNQARPEIFIDISDNACLSFGFRHGDKVLTPSGLQATIAGVAKCSTGQKVLWYKPWRVNGVCYYANFNRNLTGLGFKKLVK